MISQKHDVGVPIVVLVDNPACCYCKLNVPDGIITLQETYGVFTGILEPGCECCFCGHRQISAMITTNTIRFNAPIKECPTADNVRVTVEVGINFHIGNPETLEKDCKNFFYYLGANRLQEMLEQESEENVRNFVRTIKVGKVRDIKSELTLAMQDDMNRNFNEFGVYIESVVIMRVIIPRDLRTALTRTTAYDVHLQNQIKVQENNELKLQNAENKILIQLKLDQRQEMSALTNKLAVNEIEIEEAKIKQETSLKTQTIRAQATESVAIIDSRGT